MRENYRGANSGGKRWNKTKLPDVPFTNSDKSKHMTTLEDIHGVYKSGREDSSSLPFKNGMSAPRSMVMRRPKGRVTTRWVNLTGC